MSTSVASREEQPMFFEARDHVLFGILTQPTSNPRGVTVVSLPGGGTLSTNVNRLSVHFHRRMAASGFHSLRFDYHGVGESSGDLDRFDLAAPFVADLEGALDHLRANGLERFVLVGSCFGARTVLTAAPNVSGLEGVVLVSPPIRDFEMGERIATRLAGELSVGDFARRAVSRRGVSVVLNAKRRKAYYRVLREKLRYGRAGSEHPSASRQARYEVSPRFQDPLRDVAQRAIPVLLVYGDADDLSSEFERAASGPLRDIAGLPNVRRITLSGTVHAFNDSEVAERVFDHVATWINELPDGLREVTSP
ncbi:MAG: alpha/beta fold hydrolase [Actinomycetota bacterium]